MIITVIVVLLVLVYFVPKIGLSRAALHPFTWVCLYYLFFFVSGTTDAPMRTVVDIAVCLSFICFSAAFLIFHRKFFRQSHRFMSYIWRGGSALKPMKTWQLVTLAHIPLMYSIALVYVRTVQVGSFTEALFGFYAIERSAEALWLARSLGPLLGLSLGAILLLRIDAVAYRNRLAWVLSWLSSLLMLLVLSTKGTRGSLIAVAVVILLADSCVSVRKGRGTGFRPGFFVLAGVAVALAVILTEIRGQSFYSYADLRNRIEYLGRNYFLNEGVSELIAGGSIGDEVAFCLRYYGRESPFLYFHTPWAIAVNLVPREFWSNKPVGFGKILAQDKGFGPNNPTSVAAGLAGEGYANGGWLGIVGLSLFIGMICGTASGLAYGFFLRGGRVHIILGLMFWRVARSFTRGGMLSAWSSVYPVVATILLILLLKNLLKNLALAETSREETCSVL